MLRGKPMMDLSGIDPRPRVAQHIRDWSDAVKSGDVAACRRLVEAGIDPSMATERGFPPLVEAIRSNMMDLAKFLIERGANVNCYDKFGWCALLYAVRHGDLEICRQLVGAGASPSFIPPNAPKNCLTVFRETVKTMHDHIVRFFVDECGEDPAQRTKTGRTMMQTAAHDSVKSYLRSIKTGLAISDALALDSKDVQTPQKRSDGANIF